MECENHWKKYAMIITWAGVALCLRAMDWMIGSSTTAVDPHEFPGPPRGEYALTWILWSLQNSLSFDCLHIGCISTCYNIQNCSNLQLLNVITFLLKLYGLFKVQKIPFQKNRNYYVHFLIVRVEKILHLINFFDKLCI